MDTRHYRLRITGTVQGVLYRRTAVNEAQRLGLRGFAQNLPDGSVLIEAEGEPTALDALIAWCRTGPPRAQVHDVEVRTGELVGFDDFRIRR